MQILIALSVTEYPSKEATNTRKELASKLGTKLWNILQDRNYLNLHLI